MCSVFIIHLYSRYNSHSVLARRSVVADTFCFYFVVLLQHSSVQYTVSSELLRLLRLLPCAILPQMYEAGVMGMEEARVGSTRDGQWWWRRTGSLKDGLLGVVVGVVGVVVWWRGEDNNNARARAGTSRKTPSLFYLCVFVCLDGGLFCLFCLIVSSCFVLFCWVGLCIRFIYYLSTAHSSFPRY